MGYVGRGLADGVSIGNVFSSPSSDQMFAVTRAINGGSGVLYLFGNYQGDIMNFEMAREMAEMEGIQVEMAIMADDVASAPREKSSKRRGVAGLFYAYKIIGAKAEENVNLEEVIRVAKKVMDNTRTMGVALSPCTIPAVGKPTFTIGDDEMEIGMGIHGEPGVKRGRLEASDRITETLMEQILNDLPFKSGDSVSILVNSLGATPKEELFIIFRKAWQLLMDSGINVYRPYIGEYATSLEMVGCSITLIKLDEEIKKLLDAPAESPFFLQK
jgi:dihydroxyacetone kinase